MRDYKHNNNIQDVLKGLCDHIDHFATALYPDRHVERHHDSIRIGNQGSLTLCCYGEKAGCWHSFENGEGGHLISLVQKEKGYDFQTALLWCRDFLSLPNPCKTVRSCNRKTVPNTEKNRQKVSKAKHIWNNTVPIQNTGAEFYLKNRGITIPLPESLRFVGSLPYVKDYKKFPAMVAKVTDKNGNVTGIQATYLDPVTFQKIQSYKAKICRGSIKENFVALSKRSSHMIICEGIEDGLSLLQLYPDFFVICTLGASNMEHVQIPDCVTDIIIASDNDIAGITASDMAYERFKNEGYSIRITTPEQGKDFNEFLQQYSKEVIHEGT